MDDYSRSTIQRLEVMLISRFCCVPPRPSRQLHLEGLIDERLPYLVQPSAGASCTLIVARYITSHYCYHGLMFSFHAVTTHYEVDIVQLITGDENQPRYPTLGRSTVLASSGRRKCHKAKHGGQ